MNNSVEEKQDLRVNSGMEESNAMTIEFLRARLLSERSVSKSARQRADELAETVAELEEQLRIVSLQRMKAEKATADVLAILGDHGLSDFSETVDSNSDQDTPSESRMSNKSSKEEENAGNSKARKDETEPSGSDFEFSPVPGRSLSWQGRRDGAHFDERYKDPFHRRRNSVASISPSPKHRPGKSCRQIRRKESRYVHGESKANAMKVDSPLKETSTTGKVPSTDGGKETAGEAVEDSREKVLLGAPVSGGMENQENASGSDFDFNMQGREVDMEQALEHRAQLIGQYEAMERTQREWEEKFGENNSSTPDSCDPGNRSDITEERYEMKEQAPHTPETIKSQTSGPNAEAEDLSKFQGSGLSPSLVDVGQSKEWKSNSTPASEPLKEEFAFPMESGKQNIENYSSNFHSHLHHSDNNSLSLGLQGFPAIQSAPSFPSNPGPSFSKKEVSVNERYALVPQKGSEELSGILEALKQAKQSLQQKMKDLPLVEGGSVGPSLPSTTLRDTINHPVGSIGLFRLPTDFVVEDNSRANTPSSAARLSLGSYYPDTTISSGFSNRFIGSPYLETRSSSTSTNHFLARQYKGLPVTSIQEPYLDPSIYRGLPSSGRYMLTEDQYHTRGYEEGGPQIHVQKPYFDPSSDRVLPSSGRYVLPEGEILASRYAEFGSRLPTQRPSSDLYTDVGLLASTRYTLPTYPVNPSYHDPMLQMPAREVFSTSLPRRIVSLPPADHSPFSNEHIRPNMYR